MHSFGFPQLLQDLCHAKRERERSFIALVLLGTSRTVADRTSRDASFPQIESSLAFEHHTLRVFDQDTHHGSLCRAFGHPVSLVSDRAAEMRQRRFLSQQVDQPWEANQSEDLPIGPRTRNRPSRHTQSLLRPQKPRSLCSLWVVNPRSQS